MNTLIRFWMMVALWAVASVPGWAASDREVADPAMTMQTVQSSALRQAVEVGQSVKLHQVVLDAESAPVTLSLERFEVFEPDARIIVHRRRGRDILTAPDSAYFRGGIQGDPDSVAVLSADASGEIRGIVQSKERFWVLGQEPAGAAKALASREVQQSGLADVGRAFQCGVDQLPQSLRSRTSHLQEQAVAPAPLLPGETYQVPIAIESDAEFYNRFGNANAALAYIGNLFAYSSTIYRQETAAELLVGSVSLWSGGVSADPWSHTSTSNGLESFRSYWRANRQGVKRAAAHFLSGKNLGGGIAYLGSLCDNNYGYGYSANIAGNFSISAPQTVWDILVVTHEIGHNFDSYHTHDYANIGGDSRPVDLCYQNGSTGSLPGLGSLSGGSPGAGTGTIMSYCHLLSPGYSNITMTFGQNHPYGVKAYRVSDVIKNYVAQAATAYPTCITVGSSQTFSLDVSVSGGGTVVSSPAGINCGTTCGASFKGNTAVTLTATPATGSGAVAWGGDCASQTGSSCVLQMTSNRSVTAQFKGASSITLSASSTAPKYGDSTTFTATVSGNSPTGTVTFKEGTTTLGSSSVSDGKAAAAVSSLTVGSHTVLAAYSGDDKHAASNSSGLVVSVGKRNSSVTVGVSSATPRYGDPVTLSATVTGKSPTGVVTFKDGATILGTAAVSGGQAAIVTSSLAIGSHSISARYGGDGNHNTSSSSLVGLSVGKLASSTALTASPAATKYGERVTLTAVVSGTSPTGSVTFRDGATAIGSAALRAGQATLVTATLGIGSHSISANYLGDTRHNASGSGAQAVTVEKVATTTALSTSAASSKYGSRISLIASVVGAAPTGTITFRDGAAILGSGTLSRGRATFSTYGLSVGTHGVTAEYAGDAKNAASISPAVGVTIEKAASTIALGSATATPRYGDSLMLTASVGGTAPTGVVTFADGPSVLGSAPLVGGKAAMSAAGLAVGSHTITAAYSGDGNYAASTSHGIALSVLKRSSSVVLGLSPSLPKFGDTVTWSATVVGLSPTGSVTFRDGAATLGTGVLSGGQAYVVTSGLTAGSHRVTAIYSGDGNHTGSSTRASFSIPK